MALIEERFDSRHVLWRPLSVLLPTEEQTWLLQACLWPDDRGQRAWAQWTAAIDDAAAFLRRDNDGVKGLLSLLFHSLQERKIFIEKVFQTYIRTAYARDELRSKSYGSICGALVSALAGAGVPAIVLKGAALAETAYENPALQHAHYLEILIHHQNLNRAAQVLPSLGFTRSRDSLASSWPEVEWIHESGLPLIVHWDLFRIPFYRVELPELWSRCRMETLSGLSTRVLSPADNLMHICASRFDIEQRDSLRWACDAWFLLHRSPELDWEVLLRHASEGRMALPLFMTLNYLWEKLNAPIPPDVLQALHAAAAKSESIERELALFGVQRNVRGGPMKMLLHCRDWSTRAWVMKWALLPSPAYVRWFHGTSGSWLLPFYYIYRPVRYLARASWFLSRRLVRRLRQQWVSAPLQSIIFAVCSLPE
jgi:hypothetical protein